MPSRVSAAPHHGACPHCRAALGQNDPLDGLPLGRRLVFDSVRRRIWIVCLSCARWCLPVAYAREDALEACERHFRDASPRIASGGVCMVRHASGVELIRVDDASAFEIAAWRYAQRADATARWRSALLGESAEAWLLERLERLRASFAGAPYLAVGLAVGVLSSPPWGEAVAVALVLLAFFRMFTLESELHEKQLARQAARADVAIGRIVEAGGDSFVLHADQAWKSRIVGGAEPHPWRLSVPARPRRGHPTPEAHELVGSEAVRALRLALAEAGAVRLGTAAIRAATDAVAAAGGARAFLATVPAEIARRGLRYATVAELPARLRLALQIAADEAHEANVLEGEHALLEREWREAHELAALETGSAA